MPAIHQRRALERKRTLETHEQRRLRSFRGILIISVPVSSPSMGKSSLIRIKAGELADGLTQNTVSFIPNMVLLRSELLQRRRDSGQGN